MLAAVDSHTLIKFFHVFPAIVWIGGAVMLTILAELTKRANEPGAMARFARPEADVLLASIVFMMVTKVGQ